MSCVGCKSRSIAYICSNAVYQRRADQNTNQYAIDRRSYNREIDPSQILYLPFQLWNKEIIESYGPKSVVASRQSSPLPV